MTSRDLKKRGKSIYCIDPRMTGIVANSENKEVMLQQHAINLMN